MAATSALEQQADPAPGRTGPARIGPDSLIQTREVVRRRYGTAAWAGLRIRARARELPVFSSSV